MRRQDLLALAILILLPALFFFDVVAGTRRFFFVDLMRFHHPGKKVLRDIVLGGEFPYWNPYLSAGQPLAANPQHEVFYPLNWLIFLPSYETGFQLLILIHIATALVAMFALLRSMELAPPASFTGAVAYGLGIVLSFHHMLPHLFSAAWLPLTCLYARRALLHRRPRDFAAASLFLGLQFLAGEPAMLLETAMLIAAYALYRGIRDKRVLASLLLAAAIGSAGVLTGAAQMLPGIDHVSDSVRGRGIRWEEASLWSMPPLKLAELVYPNLLGHMSHGGRVLYWGGSLYKGVVSPYLFSLYCGLLIATLAVAGFVTRLRGWLLASALLAVSILLALGANTPLLRLLHDSGLTFLRFFEKFMFPGAFTLIVFGACAMERLLNGDRHIRLAAMIVAAVVTSIALFFTVRGGHWPFDATPLGTEMRALSRSDWSLASLRGAALLLLLGAFERVRRPLWIALAGLFVIADLAPVIREITPRTDRALFESTPIAARKLAAQPGRFRIFHEADWHDRSPLARSYVRMIGLHGEPFRNAMLPPIPSEFGLPTVMEADYDLTALLPTTDFTTAMTAIGYRTRSGWPQPMAAMSNAWFRTEYRPIEDAVALARGDIRQLQPVAFFPLQPHPRYYFADRIVTIRGADDFVRLLSTQPFSNSVAFVAIPSFAPANGVVRRVEERANRIRLEVESAGRGFLVLSVTPHKYWRVRVDGRDVQPVITNIGYQGLELARGAHVIEMQYRNPLIAIGVAISLVTIAILAAVVFRRAEARRSTTMRAP